jgi:hypothetical protein
MRLLSLGTLTALVALFLLGGAVQAGDVPSETAFAIKASHAETTIHLDASVHGKRPRVEVLQRLLIHYPRGVSHHVLRVVASDATSARAVAFLAAWAMLRDMAWRDFEERLGAVGLSAFQVDVLSSTGAVSCAEKSSWDACESIRSAFASMVDGASGLGGSGRDRSLQRVWRTGLAAFGVRIDPTPVMPPDCDTPHLEDSKSVAKGVWVLYQLPVCAGQTIVVRTEGSVGDVDLYLRFDLAPNYVSYDLRGYSESSNEMLVYTAPTTGTLNIGVNGYAASSNFVLKTSDY